MTNEYEIVINYFLKRKVENMNFLKYKYFKNLIKYCFCNFTDYEARKIFNIMEKLEYFKRRKILGSRRSFEYKFINPYIKEKKDNSKYILHFN